jgi:DNA-binding NtrC family response regulator
MTTRDNTILIVDDERLLRKTIKSMVTDLGYAAVEAADGKLGLEELSRHGQSVVAVILDQNMPNMGGEEMLAEIRKVRKKLPVVISSASNDPELPNRTAHYGYCSFLSKPYSFSALEQVLRTSIGENINLSRTPIDQQRNENPSKISF